MFTSLLFALCTKFSATHYKTQMFVVGTLTL